MSQNFFMGELPDSIKKKIKDSLQRGELPRSQDFGKVQMSLPDWDKYLWKNWAENNGIELPENFLEIVK